MARSSVKIGIIMLLMWAVPLLGHGLSVAGLALGITAYSKQKDDMARAGIFLNSLGLGLSLLNIAVSLYLLSSGAFDLVEILEQLNLPY